jgi:GT2 family glycosyltransferase
MPALPNADADVYRKNREVMNFRFTSPSVCLYRRATFESLGGWDKELLAIIDWEMYSRMVRKGGGICYLHQVLAIMRMHNNRHSNTSAMHWDFFHDVLILSSRPGLRGGGLVEARAVMEQLLWDLRLRRRPWATLRHAWKYGAMKSFVLLLPFEIIRRILVKGTVLASWRRRGDVPSRISPLDTPFDRDAADAFWNKMVSEP